MLKINDKQTTLAKVTGGRQFMMARKPKCQHLKADVHVIAIAGQQRDGYTVAFLLLYA